MSHLDDAAFAHLQSWQGRSQTLHDTICHAPLLGLAATLDESADAASGPWAAHAALPPLAHWLFFLPRQRQSELGPDGHARRGGFLPPVPLPRRMWAGGQLQWETDNPLRVGDEAQRTSTIASVQRKRGRTGDLVFVQVRHDIANARGHCLTETHDIVYRAAAVAGQPASEPAPEPFQPAAPAHWQQTVCADDVLLFRYSALTFNGHRIHYDRRYVTEVEGYPGLIVHGPLMATWLTRLACRQAAPGARMRRFAFRALRPVFDASPITLHGCPADPAGQSLDLWITNPAGALVMQAEAHMQPTA
ncbi:MAG: FAS1-like dehydratase domain-containing protein [Ottowia sp.]